MVQLFVLTFTKNIWVVLILDVKIPFLLCAISEQDSLFFRTFTNLEIQAVTFNNFNYDEQWLLSISERSKSCGTSRERSSLDKKRTGLKHNIAFLQFTFKFCSFAVWDL